MIIIVGIIIMVIILIILIILIMVIMMIIPFIIMVIILMVILFMITIIINMNIYTYVQCHAISFYVKSMGIPGSWNRGTVPYKAIFWGYIRYIPLHSPYIGLISGRYLQFRFLKWPLIKALRPGALRPNGFSKDLQLIFSSPSPVVSEVMILCVWRSSMLAVPAHGQRCPVLYLFLKICHVLPKLIISHDGSV